MAIKKPGSRFTDRNKIREMHRQGYNVEQIATAVSIVPEHVIYVIEQWDADEEKWRDRQLQERKDELAKLRQAQQPANPVPDINEQERERIREQARRELLAEQAANQESDGQEETADAPASEEAQEEPRRPRRRKTAAG